MDESKSSSSSSSSSESSSSSSWEQKGEPHKKYMRIGGYHATSTNEIMNNRYRIIQKLGHGYFSIVYLVYDYDMKKTTSPFKALKIQKSSKSATESARDEIKMYEKLNTAEYVIMLLDHFTVKGCFGEHICMIFPLLGNNLDSILKTQGSISFPIVKSIITQVTKGLSELERKGIIHTDLKTENILITLPNKNIEKIIREYKVPDRKTQPKLIEKSIYILSKSQKKRQKKLLKAAHLKSQIHTVIDTTNDLEESITVCICDLGSACLRTNKYGTEVQTKNYMAPEVILGNDYDCAIDIWSLGCIAYELITGELLFDCDSDSELEYQENHLANIVEAVGDIPKYMIIDGKYSKRYINTDGRFKHIKKLVYQSIYEKLKNKDIDNAREVAKYIAPFLTIDMRKRYMLFYTTG